jgi:AcrR family transcriptional regulator
MVAIGTGLCIARYSGPVGYRHDREDIVEAAIDLVLAEGLASLSYGKVAKSLGISDRMVVYYFASKEVLVTSVVEAMGARLHDVLSGAFPTPASADQLLRTAWPLLASSKVDQLMAVYFEVVGLATAKKEPYVALSAALVESWVSWISELIRGDGPAERRRLALSIVARIDGLLMIRQVCGPRAANDAARALGICD